MIFFKIFSCTSFFLIFKLFGFAQTQENIISLNAWQNTLNKEYSEKATSPLSEAAITIFKGFEFFKEDPNLKVNAKLVLSNELKEISLKTSSSFLLKQIEYGQINFEVEGKSFNLTIYQSPNHLKEKGMEDYLFLPFTDESNGIETYGGGRYIDLKIPKDKNHIVVDFNRAYNPFCAYSTGFSCPKVPSQNHLTIKILGGVKYSAHH